MKKIMLITIMVLTFCLPGYPKESNSQSSNTRLQIEVKGVTRIPHINARYGLFKKLPKAEYRPWISGNGTGISRLSSTLPKGLYASFVEILVVIKNTGKSDITIDNANLKLSLPKGNNIKPIEYIFAGAFDNDAELAKALSLSNDPSKWGWGDDDTNSTFIYFGISGDKITCPLKAGESTWFDLIYQVRENDIEGKLHIGESDKVAVKIP